MKNCENYKGLLVGLIDNELTPDERREINDHLIRCAACRDDYEQLLQTSGKLESVTFAEPDDATLARIWRTPFSRMTRNASLFMIIGGYLLLVGYALFGILTRGDELPAKLGVAAVALGFLILFIQLIRERLQTYKTDPYKDIHR
jgi:anti-sigma factor RsiW